MVSRHEAAPVALCIVGSSKGRTTVSGTVNWGSSPYPTANGKPRKGLFPFAVGSRYGVPAVGTRRPCEQILRVYEAESPQGVLIL